MLRKKITSLFLVSLLAFSVSACKNSSDTIVIGGIGPLTGEVSIYGEPALNGARLYLEEKGEVLGKKIVFEVMDDKGDTTEAVTQFNNLINNKKAVAIIGAITSKPSSAVAIESQKTGIPIITPSATAPDVTTHGPNVFRACYLDPFQGETMANFAFDELKLKTFAIIYNQSDDYSSGVAEAFKKAFEAKGGTIVSNEAFTQGDQDFKTQLTKIKSASPEGLFLPVYYQDLAMIAKQAKDTGVEAQMLGVDGWDGVLNDLSDPSILNGSYFCNHYSPDDETAKVQDFLSKYRAKYGTEPNAFSALAYDSAKIMVEAIEKAGSTDSAKIVEALKSISVESVTAAGTISFDENGNPIKGVSIIKIEDGKNKLFSKIDVQK